MARGRTGFRGFVPDCFSRPDQFCLTFYSHFQVPTILLYSCFVISLSVDFIWFSASIQSDYITSLRILINSSVIIVSFFLDEKRLQIRKVTHTIEP